MRAWSRLARLSAKQVMLALGQVIACLRLHAILFQWHSAERVCVFRIAPKKHCTPQMCTSLTYFEISTDSWETGKWANT